MPDFRSGKPRWRLAGSPVQVMPAAVDTQLVFGGVSFATPSSIVTGPSVTVTRPGLYICTAKARRLVVAVSGETRIKIKVNGATQDATIIGPTTLAWHLLVSSLLQLAAGDVVTAWIQGHPTLPVTIEAGTAVFTGTRVGPERWT